METIRKFGLECCDAETMLWNVSVFLRALILKIDGRNNKPIPIIFYITAAAVCLGYFYVYLVSMSWFVFVRCQATGDLLAAIIVFSLGVSSEIGTVKLIFMFVHIDKVREIVSECLACDSLVVAGSRFSNNLLSALRHVKKRAMIFWMVIIFNGVVYIIKPFILPGRHFTEDKFILFVEALMKKWRNVRDYYIKEQKRNARAKTKGSTKKKKKYNNYDLLSFLNPILKKKRRAERRACREDYSSDEDEMVEEYLEIPHSDDMSYDQYNCADSNESFSFNNSTMNNSSKLDEVKEEPVAGKSMTSFVMQTIAPADVTQEEDKVKANKNFLLSLLPDISSLNERQNMRFRLGVLNLLNDIKFETN